MGILKNNIHIFGKRALIAVFLLFTCSLRAQEIDLTGEVSELSGVDTVIWNTMYDWNVPGAGVGVIKNGQVVFAKGFGYRDIENNLTVNTETLFPVGSITKSFTAASLLVLQQDSLLDIDKPVINYLDDFELYDNTAEENTTTRDLLIHDTGIPRHDLVWYGSKRGRNEIMKRIKYLKPNTGFRQEFQYNNLMYSVAGSVAEQVSGKSWEEFTRERILEPLEMRYTDFTIQDMVRTENYAKPYLEENGMVVEIPFRDAGNVAPAGAINSNVTDLSKWLLFNLTKGKSSEKQILSDKSFWEMQKPQIVVPSGISEDIFYSSYGLGWFITSYKGHLRVEHGGSIDGFSANIGMLPMDSIGVIVLCNMNGTPFPAVVRNIIFDRLLGIRGDDWSARLLEAHNKEKEKNSEAASINDTLKWVSGSFNGYSFTFAGTYTNPAYGSLEIISSGGNYTAAINGFTYTLKRTDSLSFEGKNEILGKDKFIFKTGKDHIITKVTTTFEPSVSEGIVFKRKKEKEEPAKEKK